MKKCAPYLLPGAHRHHFYLITSTKTSRLPKRGLTTRLEFLYHSQYFFCFGRIDGYIMGSYEVWILFFIAGRSYFNSPRRLQRHVAIDTVGCGNRCWLHGAKIMISSVMAFYTPLRICRKAGTLIFMNIVTGGAIHIAH